MKILWLAIAGMLITSCNNKPAQPEQVKQPDATKAADTANSLSVYQLEGTWQTQDNKTIALKGLKGKVQVITMIFTHCKYACPHTVYNLQNIEKNIPAELKDKVGFTLVSFDTERDTAGTLKQFMKEMDINPDWRLLHGNDEEVRELSMLLNVNYERESNGDYNHNVVISVLDKNGVIVQHYVGLEQDTKAMAAKIAGLAKQQ